MNSNLSRNSGAGKDRVHSLRNLVERHGIHLSVYTDYGPDERWHLQPVGLNLELRGSVLGEGELENDEAQQAAYAALHQVAAWAFEVVDANPQIDYEFDRFDRHVVVPPGSWIAEVELDAHLFHRDAIRQPLDDAERETVDTIRDRLATVGVKG